MYIAVPRNTNDLRILFRFEDKEDMEGWLDEFNELAADRLLRMDNSEKDMKLEMGELVESIFAIEKNMSRSEVPAMFGMPAAEYETVLENEDARNLMKHMIGEGLPEETVARNAKNMVVTKLDGWGRFDVTPDDTFPENKKNIIVWYRCDADIQGLAAVFILLFYPGLIRKTKGSN